jgi:hypothetical protein
MHEFADVWFVNVLYVPALQFKNVGDANGQYWPDGHTMHECADVWFISVLYVPGSQLLISPREHQYPAGHTKHAAGDDWPNTELYLPAGHTWQISTVELNVE